VHHHHHVGAIDGGARVAGLLVRAVAAVGRVTQHVEAFAERHLGGLVGARIVHEQRAVGGLDRDGGGHERDRARGVVGGQDDVHLQVAAAVLHARLGRGDRLHAMSQHHAFVAKR
jgi:hypothetical protein